uniref:Fatty-acid amide hydrolase 2-B-like n=1 Tax=Hirondellea gigas TaxID=1518452 RepID=A0A2P2I5R6_9CRUS
MGAPPQTSRIVALLLLIVWPGLRLLRVLYDRVVHFVFSVFFWFKKKTPLPPVFNPTLLLSATHLARAIRERKMTSAGVVRSYISRISDVNPLLNALAQEVFRDALQEARRVDERIAQGYDDGSLNPEILEETEPFLGVPFTVKESIAVAGLNHTSGLISRRFVVAYRDADVVERMKEAGGILLATTNVSELGLWWESENRLYGKTNNPYDLNRTAGGSSGGESALMCACGTPMSIGSDVGGSLRTPAFFCGLFSHKPTPGHVSLRGVGIMASPDNNSVFVAGPITRHAEDIIPMLKVLCTKESITKLRLSEPVNLAHVRLYSIADDDGAVLTSPVCRELRQAQDSIRKYFLQVHDTTVVKMRLPLLSQSFSIWREKMAEIYRGHPGLLSQLGDNKDEIDIWAEIVRAALGRANHTWPALLQAAGEKLRIRGSEEERNPDPYPRWRILLGKLQRTLGSNGVLLYPSHPTLAPYHREPLMLPLNFTYTAIFNALGLPVTQVPLGLSSNGLPLGIQVVGGLGMDRLTVAVAADLEKGYGGWKCPAQIL